MLPRIDQPAVTAPRKAAKGTSPLSPPHRHPQQTRKAAPNATPAAAPAAATAHCTPPPAGADSPAPTPCTHTAIQGTPHREPPGTSQGRQRNTAFETHTLARKASGKAIPYDDHKRSDEGRLEAGLSPPAKHHLTLAGVYRRRCRRRRGQAPLLLCTQLVQSNSSAVLLLLMIMPGVASPCSCPQSIGG